MDKRKLYETIMSSVAKEVKKTLNETMSYDDEIVNYVEVEFEGDWHLYHYESAEEVLTQYGEYIDEEQLAVLGKYESLHFNTGYGPDKVIIKV